MARGSRSGSGDDLKLRHRAWQHLRPDFAGNGMRAGAVADSMGEPRDVIDPLLWRMVDLHEAAHIGRGWFVRGEMQPPYKHKEADRAR